MFPQQQLYCNREWYFLRGLCRDVISRRINASVGWWASESVSEELVGELVSYGKATPKKLATATSEKHHRFQAGNCFPD
jgi:hypothetical protein